MHLPTPLSLLTLAALNTLTPRASPAPPLQSFTNSGQLRTRWNEGDHADLGCLTATGLWTANDSLCDTFMGTEVPVNSGDLPAFKLTSAAGACKVVGARFECGSGGEGMVFGIWQFPNSIPNVDCLRLGQYGLMSTPGRSPPMVEDPPQEIRFTSYSDKGKYVWLTWRAVENGEDGGGLEG